MSDTIHVMELKPVLDLVSKEVARLQLQMSEIGAKLDLHALQIERHRLELVRLSRAVASMRKAPTRGA